MVVTECLFNPERDLKPVEEFGFVDLKDAFVHSCVPSQVGESDADYNGIDNPESILGIPRDVFDALRMVQDLDARSSKENNDKDNG